MLTKTIMIQGTTSDAGKSTLVTALCRILSNQGKRVAPFKPQNMALNSAVTEDRGEIGRAQALQAQAARLKPHTDMNPILIKPTSDTKAQIIVHGKVFSDMTAESYQTYKSKAMSFVLESFYRLKEKYDWVIVEGAGSPAEINLRKGDIANMGFAEEVDCPVILIADIDRGGVFAHLVGTLELLSPSERNRVIGFVINRFRGDISLLKPGLDWLEHKTGKPVLGVLPYLQGLKLDAEDALTKNAPKTNPKIKICALALPRISNHTDLDPLRTHPDIDFTWVGPTHEIPACDLIVIPGSKNVIADLTFLEGQKWDLQLKKHLRYGGKLIGLCGGFQMLGNLIEDPLGVEGEVKNKKGLGLLDFTTILEKEKILMNQTGFLWDQKTPLEGYEIHCGRSNGLALNHPAIYVKGEAQLIPDGARSQDDQIFGTYLHGLFDQKEALIKIITWAGTTIETKLSRGEERDLEIERLASCVQTNLALHFLE